MQRLSRSVRLGIVGLAIALAPPGGASLRSFTSGTSDSPFVSAQTSTPALDRLGQELLDLIDPPAPLPPPPRPYWEIEAERLQLAMREQNDREMRALFARMRELELEKQRRQEEEQRRQDAIARANEHLEVTLPTPRPIMPVHSTGAGLAACGSCHGKLEPPPTGNATPPWVDNPLASLFDDVTPGLFVGRRATSLDGTPWLNLEFLNQVPGPVGGLNLFTGAQNEGVEGGSVLVPGSGPPVGRDDVRAGLSAAMSRVAEWFGAWWKRTPASRASVRTVTIDPGRGSQGARAGRANDDGPSISFVATGNASGDAFRLRVSNPSRTALTVTIPDGLVLEPVSGAVPALPAGAKEVAVNGYCLDFAKASPPASGVYRIAAPAAQARLRDVRKILRAARALGEAGRLHPDSDPALYGQAIRQYALWAKFGNWDAKSFAQHFLERTKKNLTDAKQPWTKETEIAITAVAPNRWRDITRVLQVAAAGQ